MNRSQQLREVFAELKQFYGEIVSAGELLRLAAALIETYQNIDIERYGDFGYPTRDPFFASDVDKAMRDGGCPLSPLIGGFFLNALDAAAAKLRLFYVRFMDDILILAPTRWQLRGAVKAVNQTLGALGLEKHPDKTFIGRIERGFDFLGYHFSPAVLTVAKQTIANFIEKASRLYEQKRSAVLAVTALEMYSMRWLRWANGGLVIPRAVAAHTDGLFA